MVTFNKKYANDDVTVNWEPDKCIHSGNCARNLLSVFNPRMKPWINMEDGTTEHIIQTVEKCPSGALSWSLNSNEGEK